MLAVVAQWLGTAMPGRTVNVAVGVSDMCERSCSELSRTRYAKDVEIAAISD